MARPLPSRRGHLRIVQSSGPATALAEPARHRMIKRLTQDLVDVLIEMHDLIDDDPDLESDAELEDDDGI